MKAVPINIGDNFGKLTVISKELRGYKLKCECGNFTVTSSWNVRTGHTLSCGCYKIESFAARNITHGCSNTRTYKIWEGIKQRTCNSKRKEFKNYGGRGILICVRWKHSYAAFLEDMGECPANHSIERIDNQKGYSKNNCRWATKLEQNNNHRRNVLVEFRGETKNLTQWAKEFGLPSKLVHSRYRDSKWPIEKVLTTPIGE